jgi:hypothetical protein
MKIIGILVAITCLAMGGAAQATCPTSANADQLRGYARLRDMTPEQAEMLQIGVLLARSAAGFQTATEELLCRGWSQGQIDEAVRRMVAQRARERLLHSN